MTVIVHLRHIRQARYCLNQTRPFFARHSWPWQDFLDNGRPAQDFIATGDPRAIRVAEIATQEATDGRR